MTVTLVTIFASYGGILLHASKNGNSLSASIPHTCETCENSLLSGRTGIRAAWEARLEP